MVETVPREIADFIVFDQHVALAGECANSFLCLRIGKVQRDRLLAPIAACEVRALRGVIALRIFYIRRPPGAGVVAGAGPLDLDYFGAEIGEDLRRERP